MITQWIAIASVVLCVALARWADQASAGVPGTALALTMTRGKKESHCHG